MVHSATSGGRTGPLNLVYCECFCQFMSCCLCVFVARTAADATKRTRWDAASSTRSNATWWNASWRNAATPRRHAASSWWNATTTRQHAYSWTATTTRWTSRTSGRAATARRPSYEGSPTARILKAWRSLTLEQNSSGVSETVSC